MLYFHGQSLFRNVLGFYRMLVLVLYMIDFIVYQSSFLERIPNLNGTYFSLRGRYGIDLNTRCTRTRPVLQKLCQVFFSTSTSYYFEEILSEKNCESVKPLRHPRQTRHIFRNRQTENHCSIPYTTILLPYTRLRTKRQTMLRF